MATQIIGSWVASNNGTETVYVSNGVTISGAVTLKGGTVTVLSGATVSGLTGLDSGGFPRVILSGGTLTIAGGTVVTCFLAGSMIETEAGEKAIEDFSEGDLVTVYRHGMPGSERVVHLVRDRVTVRPHLSDDEAGYPVRIAAGAFGPGQPIRI